MYGILVAKPLLDRTGDVIIQTQVQLFLLLIRPIKKEWKSLRMNFMRC